MSVYGPRRRRTLDGPTTRGGRPTQPDNLDEDLGGSSRRSASATAHLLLPSDSEGESPHSFSPNRSVRRSIVNLLRSLQAVFWLAKSPVSQIASPIGSVLSHLTRTTCSAVSLS